MPIEIILALWQQYNGDVVAFALAIAREAVNDGQPIEDAHEPSPDPQMPLAL